MSFTVNDDTAQVAELRANLDHLNVPQELNGFPLTLWSRAAYLWQNVDPHLILMPFPLRPLSSGAPRPLPDPDFEKRFEELVGEALGDRKLDGGVTLEMLFGKGAQANLEPKPEAASKIDLTDGQAKAWAKLQRFMVSNDQFFLLRGYSGTGKTYMIQKLLEEGASKQQIILAATTNKAAKVMTKMLGRKARTIYSVLGIRMEAEDDQVVLQYPDSPPKGLYDLTIVIDEASMIGRKLLDFIVKAARELNLKIIFVGDPAQLRPVGETRSPVWSLVKDPECRSLLTEVKRYDDQLLVLATAIRNCIKKKDYNINLRDYADQKQVICLGAAAFERNILKAGSKARVVAWRNRTVDYFNDLIRSGLGFNAPYCVGDNLLAAAPISIDDEIVANTDDEFLVNEVVSYTVQTRGLEIPCWRLVCGFDESSIVLTIPTPKGRRALDSQLANLASEAKGADSSWGRRLKWKEFWELKNKFNKVRYGFAITAHRAQGSTFEDVFVDQQDILANREEREAFQCLYVAESRASNRVFFN